MGSRIVDSSEFDIYHENWNCGPKTTVAPVGTKSPTVAPEPEVPEVFRIPPNLVMGLKL